jgi:nucleoid DNA-binding protein
MTTITKKAMIKKISDRKRIDPKSVKMIVEEFLGLVRSNLKEGNRFEFRDFGVFEVVQRKAKIGRNPKSPEKRIVIPPRKAVKFTPGRKMKASISN